MCTQDMQNFKIPVFFDASLDRGCSPGRYVAYRHSRIALRIRPVCDLLLPACLLLRGRGAGRG
eukprot:SAG31_NODE_4910_length_2872_cov_2.604039_5_plen_62_part_01